MTICGVSRRERKKTSLPPSWMVKLIAKHFFPGLGGGGGGGEERLVSFPSLLQGQIYL